MTTPGVDPSGTTPGNPVGPAGAPAGSPASGSVTSGWPGRTSPDDERGSRSDGRSDGRSAERPADDPRADGSGRPASSWPPPDRPTAYGQSSASSAPAGQAPAGRPAGQPRSAEYDPRIDVPGGGQPRPAQPRPAQPRPPQPPADGTVTPAVRQVRRRPGARKARLRLTRVDPWSALKTSLVFSGFLFIVWMVAVFVLFLVLLGAGTFHAVNDFLSSVLGSKVDFNGGIILGGAAVVGALSVVLVSALGTVMAFAYNVTASLMGGIDVTFTESEG